MPESDRGYTKIPNSFLRFFSKTPLTPQHVMMLLCAIRNCHGYHKPERVFDLKDLKRWLSWDRRRLSQTAIELSERGCFCPHGADKKTRKYQIENDCRKWNRSWKRRKTGRAVDNPVDKPLSPVAFADTFAALADGLSAPCGQTESLSTAEPSAETEPNASIDQAFDAASETNIRYMLEFLKKSLKKSLKKEDSDLQKRKNQIFSEMARSGLWRDDELIPLAKHLTAGELEDLYARRRAAG
ncbi:MAG TPA: hypothetical protein VGH22_15445 [Candidatus Binatia bacterium]